MAHHNEVSVPDPAIQALVDALEPHPVVYAAIHNTMFKERASKKYGNKKHGSQRVNGGHGPETQQLGHVCYRDLVLVQHKDGDGQAD